MACIPAFREPEPRLELLDEQGVHASLMFPTLASLIEERLLDDPELTQVAIHAFNEWLHDEWTYDYEGRLFATPIVNPCLLDEGIAELELLLERGAKAVLLRPAPVSGLRGLALALPPRVRPVLGPHRRGRACWWRCTPPTAATRTTSTPGRAPGGEYVAFRPKTFAAVADGGRSIQDALASAICHGMLTRFPGVKLISVENGGQLGRRCS